jgi:DnaK suppressor protein
MDADAIRAELEARRDRARETIAGLAKTPERGTAQGFGKRIGDGTVEAISRLTDIGVGTSLEAGLERTERALAKLDEGTYGLCDVCGQPIAEKRLAAMPDAVTCVGCASAQPRVAPRRR